MYLIGGKKKIPSWGFLKIQTIDYYTDSVESVLYEKLIYAKISLEPSPRSWYSHHYSKKVQQPIRSR
ncbi:MAG: hypothetical protein ACMUEM_04845 [Flavobacteriales bacterium AspAUS03]